MSTRIGDDACKQRADEAQTKSEFDYTFFAPKYSYHESCRLKSQTCHLPDDVRADIENELRRLDQKATKCGAAPPGTTPCLADGSCDRKSGFTPARVNDRDVAWTNLKKPDKTGL
jgi:hypothetical protein